MKETQNTFEGDTIFLLDSKFPEELYDDKYEFPYKVTLSFDKLIEHIRNCSEKGAGAKKGFADAILKQIKANPEISGTIYDIGILKKHETLISDMMAFVFPDAFMDKQVYGASTAFMSDIIFASPRFNKTIKIVNSNILGELNIDPRSFKFGKMVSVFATIIHVFYDPSIAFDFPLIYMIIDPETGLDRYFKMNMASEFMDIKLHGKPKEMTEEDIRMMRANIYDLDFMVKMLPPENFEFTGFLVMHAINITDTEILSNIKRDLVERETIKTFSGFLKLQHKVKSLLRSPELLLGILDYSGNINNVYKFGSKIGNSFLMDENCVLSNKSVKGSVYEYAYNTGKAVIIENLKEHPGKTWLEEEIIRQGINNLLIAPLIANGEVVGLLELGSPKVGALNKINVVKLRDILPLFAMAILRNREEFENKIETLIKEKCTAIHPSLEWRFRNAAINVLRSSDGGKKAEMEEIVFNDVYPLYGLSDIRNSSLHRNEAIKDDLIENINYAREVIELAKKEKPLYIFDDLLYRLDKKVNSLNFGITSGDEARILGFLNVSVIKLFDYLKTYGRPVVKAIEKYQSQLDSKLGFVYKKRKDYEDSASRISDMIANFLDEEQLKMQELFPHYFERYKTDGVEHNIYIGASLAEQGDFNKLYLKNIRLWQLIMTCEIARMTKELKKNLTMQLDTAHLILVQNMPLAVKFKFDEKKFDVDGAYNVRYEIMKKRIDKAEIKGREERLTQPEKIAIVYSQDGEAQEYLDYIEYLQSINYLKKEIEEVELEELQGVTGLRALRVGVESGEFSNQNLLNTDAIVNAVKKLRVQ